MTTLYGVWQSGGSYEPSYLVEVFTSEDDAKAWTELHDGGSTDSYWVHELQVDSPKALALVKRGTRPWACYYSYEARNEWDPENDMIIKVADPAEAEKAPEVFKYLNLKKRLVEVWEAIVIAPTAADARRIAVEQIENARADQEAQE